MSDEALDSALRTLGHRDRSVREIDRRLAERGFSDDERAEALATLGRTGLVDDTRYAYARAASLAARGAGDERIRYELERAGVMAATIEDALAELDPERERASRIVERRGRGPKTARYLHAHGFAGDVIAAVAASSTEELG